jgi:hypothetical protein
LFFIELRDELLKLKNYKTKMRLWNRQRILRRNNLGASTNLLKEISVEDQKAFFNHLRMDEENFLYLLEKVSPYIKKKNTNMREALIASLFTILAMIELLKSTRSRLLFDFPCKKNYRGFEIYETVRNTRFML